MLDNLDVICVGTAKIDTFLTLHQANKHLRLIEETNELCIKSGEKITVDKAEILLGGNAANVSVGLSRLGLKIGIVAEIGKDEFAQKIINTLNSENVDTSKVLQASGQQSSFSTIINFKGERTIFSEHVKRDHNFNFDDIKSKWAYLTSLGEKWEDAYEKFAEFAKNNNVLLAFNPGTIQIDGGIKTIEKILSITEILFLNKDESQFLLGNKTQDTKEMLWELQKLGPKIVVVTDGKNGSYAVDKNKDFYTNGVIETEVVEKTGAGDAFSSGFLAAILQNKSIQEAMRWGAKNSSSVIEKIGAQKGLLRKEEMK